MSNDLISRSALVNRMKTSKGLKGFVNRLIFNFIEEVIIPTIEEQPTAYDVDKVVEQIEKKSRDNLGYHNAIEFEDVVEIVKNGGKK